MQHLRPLSNPGLTLLLEYADTVQVGCCSTCPSFILLFSSEAWKSFMASFQFHCIPILQPGYLAKIFVYYGPLFLLLSFLPCSLHIHSLASTWRTQTPWCKIPVAAKPGQEAAAWLLTAAFVPLSFLGSGYRFWMDWFNPI